MAFAIVGVGMEIGIEPTARHGADLGLIPIIRDACGASNKAAAERSLESLIFTGDAIQTDSDTFCRVLAQTWRCIVTYRSESPLRQILLRALGCRRAWSLARWLKSM